jgi:hypothetical protein
MAGDLAEFHRERAIRRNNRGREASGGGEINDRTW